MSVSARTGRDQTNFPKLMVMNGVGTLPDKWAIPSPFRPQSDSAKHGAGNQDVSPVSEIIRKLSDSIAHFNSDRTI